MLTCWLPGRWGISAMIIGMGVHSIIAYYLNSYYNGRLINYPMREQVLDLFPYLAVSLLMGAVVFASGQLQFPGPWTMLVAQITIGMIVYVGLCRAIRLQAFMDVWQEMWNKLKPSGIRVSRVQGFKGDA